MARPAPLARYSPSMLERRAALIARTVWVAAAVTCAVGLLLAFRPAYDAGRWGFPGSEALIALPTVSIGAILCARRPRNPVGWQMLFGGLAYAATFLGDAYARASLVGGAPGAYPGTAWAAWVANVWWVPAVVLIFSSMLFFPDGRLPSPRWRWVLVASVAMTGLFAIATALANGPLTVIAIVDNPAGVAPWSSAGAWSIVTYTALMVPPASMIALSLIVRFRRSTGVARAQLKWLVYVVGLTALGILPFWSETEAGKIFLAIAIAAIPVAVGIAVMRYRLYEIDLLINRTIVYLAMTGIVAAVYAVSTTILERAFAGILGGDAEAGTVFTTLVIVALFTPVKTVIQAGVDRRWKLSEHRTAVRPAGDVADPIATIERLAGLHRAGALTTAEFEHKKGELLARV